MSCSPANEAVAPSSATPDERTASRRGWSGSGAEVALEPRERRQQLGRDGRCQWTGDHRVHEGGTGRRVAEGRRVSDEAVAPGQRRDLRRERVGGEAEPGRDPEAETRQSVERGALAADPPDVRAASIEPFDRARASGGPGRTSGESSKATGRRRAGGTRKGRPARAGPSFSAAVDSWGPAAPARTITIPGGGGRVIRMVREWTCVSGDRGLGQIALPVVHLDGRADEAEGRRQRQVRGRSPHVDLDRTGLDDAAMIDTDVCELLG